MKDEKQKAKSRETRRYVSYIFILVALLLYGLAVYMCNHFTRAQMISTEGQSYERAKVVRVTKDNLAEDGNRYGDQEVVVKMLSGSLKGKEVTATSPGGSLFGATCKPGLSVIVIASISGDNSVVTVYSQNRMLQIFLFALVFCVAICLIGGKKGIKSVISLVFTIVTILCILFPLMYRGVSPFSSTVIICAVVTMFTLIFVAGVNKKSASAIIGTVAGVTMAGISAWIFGKCAGISGYNVSDIESLSSVAQCCKLQIGGLLFAGIIISALGAVMDVGMSISSTIFEVHEKRPELTTWELFQSGIHVGQDLMGTMSNTLILAYVGGSITTLMLDYSYSLPMYQLINSYNIGIEIMQGLSGSIGVVLTVPVTAFVTAIMIGKKKGKE